MKREDFLTTPEPWNRAARHQSDPIRDSCAFHHIKPKDEGRFTLADWLIFFIGALFLALIFTGHA